MKIKLMLGALLLSSCAFVSCNDDATLENSNTVYITISPKDSYIMVGDTVQLAAEISNEKGDIIETPVEWTVNCENIAKKDETGKVVTDADGKAVMIPAVEIIEGSKIVANNGAQGKKVNIKAALTNGKYGLSTMTVTNHTSNGVGALLDTYYSYDKQNDVVWFVVDPAQLLLDYEPKFTNSDPTAVIPHANPVVLDSIAVGKVGYAFSTKKTPATATITMEIGPSGAKASCDVVVCPEIVSTLGTDFNLITYESTMTMDINMVDSVWVNTSVNPNYEEDLLNAEKYYQWSATGNAAQMVKQGVKTQMYKGHNAFAEVRSGSIEGETTITYNCYGTQLVTTIYVQNYKTRYPVEKITLDKESLTVALGSNVTITPSVIPLSSYAFHQPKFVSNNPAIAEIEGYSGSEMFIKGVGAGKTTITITANDKSVEVPIEVTDRVNSIGWVTRTPVAMFAGSTVEWEAKPVTASGSLAEVAWTSSATGVATVAPKAGNSRIGVISAAAVGTTSIHATSGEKNTDKTTMTVIALPSNLEYTDANTKLLGNAAYKGIFNSAPAIVLSLQPTSGYKKVSVFVTNFGSSADGAGTFNAATMPTTVNIDGATAQVVSGTMTVSAYAGDGTRNVTADLVVKVASHTFTLKVNAKTY